MTTEPRIPSILQKLYDETDTYTHYYIKQLYLCEEEIKEKSKTKALKDVVGKTYEKYMQKIYHHYSNDELTEDILNTIMIGANNLRYKGNRKLFGFTPDLVTYSLQGTEDEYLVVEAKGHYMDKCFMERALSGIAKTINNYIKEGKHIPIFEINSFTTYKKYDEILKESLEILHPEIAAIIENRLIYNTICDSDRIKKGEWFKDGRKYDTFNHPYLENISLEKVNNHIKFLKNIKKLF